MQVLSEIPFRPVNFLPISLDVQNRADGTIILRNLNPMGEIAQNMLTPLRQQAETNPDRIWLAERPEGRAKKGLWRKLSYGRAWEQIQSIASQLIARGLGPDAPLMILSGNSIEHALISYGAQLAGAAVSPISVAYSLISSDFAKLKHSYQLVRPKMIFVQDYAMFAKALEQLSLDRDDVQIVSVKGGGNRAIDYQDLLTPTQIDKVSESYHRLGKDDIARLLFTSGSTGMPKAVIYTHGMLCVNAAMGEKLMVQADDEEPPISVSWLPWNHVFGCNAVLHRMLVAGGTLYIDRGRPVPRQFDETILTLKEIAPTYYSSVPMGYNILADALEQDKEMAELFFSKLRYLAYGGAALGQDLADRMQRIAVETTGERILFTTGYGATETGPTITTVHWETARMGLLGLPIPGVELKLVPSGSKLEVRARGASIMPGYYRDEEKTKAAFDEEGFYCLGDAARFVDVADPKQGLIFDGRIAEDFKLASGTWVNVGKLRVNLIDATNGILHDGVIAGLDRDYISVLGFPDMAVLEKIVGQKMSPDDLINHQAVRDVLVKLLNDYNKKNPSSSTKVRRLLLLSKPPVADQGEITDKGYINQGAALTARADDIAKLYAEPQDQRVIAV